MQSSNDLARERDRAAFIGGNDDGNDDETRDIFKLDPGVGQKRKQMPISEEEGE
jgi:hypothetical protein